jgi:hypothetical protein
MKGTIVMQKMVMNVLLSDALPRYLPHSFINETHFVYHIFYFTTKYSTRMYKIHSLGVQLQITDHVDHANPNIIFYKNVHIKLTPIHRKPMNYNMLQQVPLLNMTPRMTGIVTSCFP